MEKEPVERAPEGQNWNKINSIVLYYNSKFKLNVHESILIEISDLSKN